MAKPSTDISPEELEKLSYKYIDECLKNTKQHATYSGKIVDVKDRHIPTIGYFLMIWIPRQGKPTIHRSTYYRWLNINEDSDSFTEEHKEKCDTIKSIDSLFRELATDIVANEGKGIFYAKNRLGMTDKQEVNDKRNVPIINVDPIADNENKEE